MDSIPLEQIIDFARLPVNAASRWQRSALYIPMDGTFGAIREKHLSAEQVYGGTLNAPLINYYEHATFLSLNHAHTALF